LNIFEYLNVEHFYYPFIYLKLRCEKKDLNKKYYFDESVRMWYFQFIQKSLYLPPALSKCEKLVRAFFIKG